jgi:hypothetical protein
MLLGVWVLILFFFVRFDADAWGYEFLLLWLEDYDSCMGILLWTTDLWVRCAGDDACRWDSGVWVW